MKKKIWFLGLIGCFLNLNAQENKIESTGNVGIGTRNPSSDSDLHIKDNRASLFIENMASNNWSFLRLKGPGNKLWDIAQWADNDILEFRPNGSGTNRIVFHQNGKIGLGTSNPTFNIDINSYTSNIRLKNTNANGWAYLRIHGSGNKLWDIGQWADNDILEFRPNGSSTNRIVFHQNGNVAIKGKFEAKEVKISLTPTADFVFENDYNLPTLEFIENHIKEKKHLPEIASAKEMEKNGVNVGEFQIKLLQKIEELTLYTIEQEKKIKKLGTENQELKSLSERLAKVEKLLESKK